MNIISGTEIGRGVSTDSYCQGVMNVAYFLHLRGAKSLGPPCVIKWVYIVVLRVNADVLQTIQKVYNKSLVTVLQIFVDCL